MAKYDIDAFVNKYIKSNDLYCPFSIFSLHPMFVREYMEKKRLLLYAPISTGTYKACPLFIVTENGIDISQVGEPEPPACEYIMSAYVLLMHMLCEFKRKETPNGKEQQTD